MRAWLAGLALAVACASPVLADDLAAMHAAADGFYGVYTTQHPSNGIPDDALRARYAPFVTPALESLLQQAAAAEDRFTKANKGSPPLVEGDLFSSLFEGATAVSVGTCRSDGRSGFCIVHLTYADPSGKPTVWTDTVDLVNTAAGWRVDDVAYGGSWAFGNKGKLSETLKQVTGF